MAVSLDDVHGQVLVACGHEFTIATDTAHMPDSGSMFARAPVAAELCEIPVQVTLAEAPPLSDLDLGQFGAYRFDASRGAIWIRRPALDPAWQLEALCGPVLLHGLAQRGVFVLHASAARQPGGSLIAFTAESGVGKSTLARVAAASGWQRVADDLLPVAQQLGRIVALPHFPQPKLDASQQYPADAPPAMPLAALVKLVRGTVAAFERLAPREAAELMLASTVAARVFAGRSLASHLTFAACLADEVTAGSLVVGCLTVAHRQVNADEAAGEALKLMQAGLVGSAPRVPGTPQLL